MDMYSCEKRKVCVDVACLRPLGGVIRYLKEEASATKIKLV